MWIRPINEMEQQFLNDLKVISIFKRKNISALLISQTICVLPAFLACLLKKCKSCLFQIFVKKACVNSDCLNHPLTLKAKQNPPCLVVDGASGYIPCTGQINQPRWHEGSLTELSTSSPTYQLAHLPTCLQNVFLSIISTESPTPHIQSCTPNIKVSHMMILCTDIAD